MYSLFLHCLGSFYLGWEVEPWIHLARVVHSPFTLPSSLVPVVSAFICAIVLALAIWKNSPYLNFKKEKIHWNWKINNNHDKNCAVWGFLILWFPSLKYPAFKVAGFSGSLQVFYLSSQTLPPSCYSSRKSIPALLVHRSVLSSPALPLSTLDWLQNIRSMVAT